MTGMTPERLDLIRQRLDATGYAEWKHACRELLAEVDRLTEVLTDRDAKVRADERAKVLAEVAGRVPFDHTAGCVAEDHWLDWNPDCGACWQDRIDAVGGEHEQPPCRWCGEEGGDHAYPCC